jgi:hypothetical protein
MNSLPEFKVEDESAIVRRHLFLPFEARFAENKADVDPDSNIAAAIPDIGDYLKTLVPAHALCMVKWARELAKLDLVIPRPFPTSISIMEYIAGMKADAQSPTDAKQALAADHVESWVRANFDPSDLKVDCPTSGGTCPSRNAKASGSPLCPFVRTLDHLMEAYRAEAKEKTVEPTPATFLFAITRYVPVAKRQDRHINTRCAVCLKRKPEAEPADAVNPTKIAAT